MAPCRQLQHQPGQVDLADLGRPVARPGAVVDLAPQAVGDAGLGASRPPCSLIGRVPADRHGRQTGHAGADVEAGRPGQAAVDDDSHAFDRQRGLGDVGGQHDPPPPGRRRGEGKVLVGRRQGAGQLADVDVRDRPRAAAPRPPGGSRRCRGGTRGRRRARRAGPVSRPSRPPAPGGRGVGAVASARRRDGFAPRRPRPAPARRRRPAGGRTGRCRRSPTSPRSAGPAAAVRRRGGGRGRGRSSGCARAPRRTGRRRCRAAPGRAAGAASGSPRSPPRCASPVRCGARPGSGTRPARRRSCR